MKSHCHSCGREYLTARALAGQAVACRSCGALNDGAGGPPPAQEQTKRRVESERRDLATGARKARTGEQRIQSGAAFTVGGTPKAADPKKLAEIEVGAMREKLAVAESVQGWRGSRVVFALGIGAASVAALIVAGIFTYRELVKPDKGIDWVPSQRAVASVTSPAADGGAFLVESKGELWLVTTLDLVAGATEISATFRDPANGAELLRLAGIRSKDMWVDRRLFAARTGGTDADRTAPYFAVAAANVEMYRPQIEALAIEPLEIAEQSDVAMGAKVVALGQVIEPGAPGASQAPLHALFDGTVSFIKTPSKGPAYLQTSARFEEGLMGGPLLLESTREIVGVQLDPFVSSYRRLAIMGEEIHEVLENGIQLGGVRKALESAAASVTVSEENVELSDLEDWPLYHEFKEELLELQANGWRPQRPKAVRTDKDGITTLTHEVLSQPEAQVAVLLLSPSPVVPIEVGSFDSPQGKFVSSELGGNGASLRVIGVKDPAVDQLATLPQAYPIGVALRTTFLGQPLPSGVVCVVLERDPNAASASGAAPAQPPSPPTTPPAQPPAQTPQPTQPPTVAPPSPPQLLPLPVGSTIASVVELGNGMAETVYASSLIGLREFDKRFLTNLPWEESIELLEQYVVNRCVFEPTDDTEFYRDIMRASLWRSFLLPFNEGELTIDESRPHFEVFLQHVPADTQVGVYLEVDPAMRRFLSLPSDGLVSQSSDIKLEHGGQSSAYWHDSDSGDFSVPLLLPWNDDELHKLQQAVEIPYSLRVRYNDGSEDRLTGRIRVNPVAQVERAYPFGLGFAALVDETHPWIKRVIDEINQRADVKREGVMIAGGGGSTENRLQSIALIWQDLVGRGLRYQNLTAADGFAQRCRLVHESLGSANANCIDGTVLLASFFQAMGIDSSIVLVPGHALLLADMGDGSYIPIETTKLGDSITRDIPTDLDEMFQRLRASSPIFRTAAVHSLEGSIQEGLIRIDEAIKMARPILAEFRRLDAEYANHREDPAWRERFNLHLRALGNQIQIIPVSLARKNGVRPVGAPSNLDQIARLPPRR